MHIHLVRIWLKHLMISKGRTRTTIHARHDHCVEFCIRFACRNAYSGVSLYNGCGSGANVTGNVIA